MARDRKRAKQRQQRRVRQNAPPPRSQPVRSDVPSALEHASGEVDEFDAALVRGAEGVPVAEDVLEDAVEQDAERADRQPVREPPAEEPLLDEEREHDGEEEIAAGQAPAKPRRTSARALAFLRASWAELQRVQWPDRPHVMQGTAVVLGFVVVAGLYLGAADWVAQKIVNLIL